MKDRSKHLSCITEDLIDSGRQLREITDKKVDCLKVFVKHKEFADWLKESLRGMMMYCYLYIFINISLYQLLTSCNALKFKCYNNNNNN